MVTRTVGTPRRPGRRAVLHLLRPPGLASLLNVLYPVRSQPGGLRGRGVEHPSGPRRGAVDRSAPLFRDSRLHRATKADMLRLNVRSNPRRRAGEHSRLCGDNAGFPRSRVFDDVVSIELRPSGRCSVTS